MAAPRPAKDIKPTDARARLLKKLQQDKLRKDAEGFRKKAKAQAADKKIRPAKDIKAGDMRSKALKEAKNIAKTRATASVAPTNTTASRSMAGKVASKIPFVGLAVDMIANAQPAGSAAERSWERRNTEQRRMKGKVGGMSFNKATQPSAYKYTGSTAKKSTTVAGRPETPGSYMPKKSTMGANAAPPGGPMTSPRKKAGVNQFNIAAQNAAAKKKAGATTGATPAGNKPKRKSWFQRRQSERYAIGSSGKSI